MNLPLAQIWSISPYMLIKYTEITLSAEGEVRSSCSRKGNWLLTHKGEESKERSRSTKGDSDSKSALRGGQWSHYPFREERIRTPKSLKGAVESSSFPTLKTYREETAIYPFGGNSCSIPASIHLHRTSLIESFSWPELSVWGAGMNINIC